MKTKRKIKFLFVAIILLFQTSVFAQDVIVLKTDEEIAGIVEDIGLEVIKYKKYENSNGPTYSILIADIFMIKYQNGEKDILNQPSSESTKNLPKTATLNTPVLVTTPTLRTNTKGFTKVYSGAKALNRNEVRAYLSNTPEAFGLYEEGRNLHNAAITSRVFSFVSYGASLSFFIVSATSEDSYNAETFYKAGWITFGSGIGFSVLDLVFSLCGNANIRSSIEIYNNQNRGYLLDPQSVKLNAGITPSGGVGFCMTF